MDWMPSLGDSVGVSIWCACHCYRYRLYDAFHYCDHCMGRWVVCCQGTNLLSVPGKLSVGFESLVCVCLVCYILVCFRSFNLSFCLSPSFSIWSLSLQLSGRFDWAHVAMFRLYISLIWYMQTVTMLCDVSFRSYSLIFRFESMAAFVVVHSRFDVWRILVLMQVYK